MKLNLKKYIKTGFFALPLLIAGCNKNHEEIRSQNDSSQTTLSDQASDQAATNQNVTNRTTPRGTLANQGSTNTAQNNSGKMAASQDQASQNTNRPLASNSAPEGLTVVELLSRIHETNEMEIKAGKLAQKKGKSKAVKSLGESLQKDHEAADKKVTALANKKNVTLVKPRALNAKEQEIMNKHQQLMSQLQSLSGEAFDKAFVTGMSLGHDDAIASLEAANQSDEDVQKLISDLLPTLRGHSREAKALDLIK